MFRIRGCRARIRTDTVTALTEDGEVRPIEHEAAIGTKSRSERIDQVGRGVDNVAARMTHDVDVIVVGGSIGGCSVAEMGVLDHSDLLEELQRPVDRRQVNVGHRVMDLFWRGVAELTDGIQHLRALRGDAHATRPKGRGEVDRLIAVLVDGHLVHRR